ncbi:hypothetical protein VTK56DRAFT_8229 [Thermocarpiscus australiensis]
MKGRFKNIHLASRAHSWDIAVEADTGCRQDQGAGSRLMEEEGSWSWIGVMAREEWNRTGFGGNWVACSSPSPPLRLGFATPFAFLREALGQIDALSPGPGTGLLLRQVAGFVTFNSTFFCLLAGTGLRVMGLGAHERCLASQVRSRILRIRDDCDDDLSRVKFTEWFGRPGSVLGIG